MGGDYAPQNAVVGAIEAFNSSDFELILVGKEKEILDVLKNNNLEFNKDCIVNADEVITMADKPTEALKTKRNSSIFIGTQLVKEGKADAFVSAGNTGAVMAASTLILGRIKGVSRPTIGTFFPSSGEVTTIFDVGSNVDAKAQWLFEYAVMGSIFVKEIYGVKTPTIGLLNVGEEDGKGNEAAQAAFKLIKQSNLNFLGNIEGRDILAGKANVVVCDGFIGNIILKFGESVPKLLKSLLKDYAEKSLGNKLKIGLVKGALKEVFAPFDPAGYGGVPLLGVNGITIIGHGSSSVLAIKNMVLRAKEMYDKNLTKKIEESLNLYLREK
jgi:glycerol-3-phosphate acyltransferase PlsX